MQAVILAGGKGIRLESMTKSIPKPLVTVNGRPFLDYLLLRLSEFKITDVLLLVGYLSDQIESYVGDGSRYGLRVSYSREEKLLGTGGALKNASEYLDQEFLVLNGDTYLPIDYHELINQYQIQNTLGMMVVYSNIEGVFVNNTTVLNDDIVSDYDKKNNFSMTHVDAGIQVFKKKMLDYIDKVPCSLEEEIFPLIINKKQMSAFVSKQRFYDMGSMQGLKEIGGVLV